MNDDKVTCVAFSPDGTLNITGSDDHFARIWQVPPPVIDDHAHPERLQWTLELRTHRKFDTNHEITELSDEELANRRNQLSSFDGPSNVTTWTLFNASNVKN